MKIAIAVLAIFLAGITAVMAQETPDSGVAEGKRLAESGISCDKLSYRQLEDIGDYYMERMHPGEAHELMEDMMGGEGSESLRQVHIGMARRLYCNENAYPGYGMMGSAGMMSGGMMGGYLPSYGYAGGHWNIVWLLPLAAVILLIVWFARKSAISNEASAVTPLNILRKRLAEGEITRREFEAMKKDIQG